MYTEKQANWDRRKVPLFLNDLLISVLVASSHTRVWL